MKIRFSAAFAAVVLLASCQKDLGINLLPNETSVNNNATSTFDCKACEYYPICDSSIYNYSEKGGGLFTSQTVGKTSSYTLTFLSDSIIGNKTYKKMRAEGGQIGFYDCNDGTTTQLVYYTNPITQDLLTAKTTILKANEPVGGMWRDTLVITANQKQFYEYTILEKATSRAVGGILYDDVIKLRKDTYIQSDGVTTPSTNYFELYYARGTGLIETKSISTAGVGSIVYHRILVSAIIP
jgi:hypothetical protein